MSKGIMNTVLGALGLGSTWDNYAIGLPVGGGVVTVPTNRYHAGAVAQAGASAPAIPVSAPGHGYMFKTTPRGRKFTSVVVSKKASDPKKTVQTARVVAERAQRVGKDVLARVAKAAAVTTKKAVLGVATAPKKLASLAALKQQATKLIAAGKKLSTHTDGFEKTVHNAAIKSKANAVRAQQVTKIHGYDDNDVAGEYFMDIVGPDWEEIQAEDEGFDQLILEEVLGSFQPGEGGYMDIMGQYGPTPDPLRPGLMTDGSPDPSYGAGGAPGGTDPSGGTTTTSSLASQLPGPPDYGAGQPPTLSGGGIVKADGTTWPQPGIDYMPDPAPNGDDLQMYDCPTDADLPGGAVLFDGSQPVPFKGLGSYTVFFGTIPGGAAPPYGGTNSGYEWHGSGGFDWALKLTGDGNTAGYTGGGNYDKVANPDAAMASESARRGWGPIIGNPQGGWTRGLRFSPSGPNGPRFFWFYDTAAQVAPWAVGAILQAELNNEITQYKAAVLAGQTDYVNAQLQDKLNAQTAAAQAQQQAGVDAQVAQQTEVANAQAAIVQQQQDAQAQTQMMQQQAQEAQLQQQQAQQGLQASDLQLQFFSQHPEAMFAPDQGGGGDQELHAVDQGTPTDGGDFGGGGDVSDQQIDWDTKTSARDTGLSDSSESDLAAEADEAFPSA